MFINIDINIIIFLNIYTVLLLFLNLAWIIAISSVILDFVLLKSNNNIFGYVYYQKYSCLKICNKLFLLSFFIIFI